MARAYLSGVPSSPSRSGSSPTHSRMVLTAPAIFWSRASASTGVASRRSRVPRPGWRGRHDQPVPHPLVQMLYLLGQLRPSKSIGGFKVYGLAGRVGEVRGVRFLSLTSRGGVFCTSVDGLTSDACKASMVFSIFGRGCSSSIASRSSGCRLWLELRIDSVRRSRSLALIEALRKGEPL